MKQRSVANHDRVLPRGVTVLTTLYNVILHREHDPGDVHDPDGTEVMHEVGNIDIRLFSWI